MKRTKFFFIFVAMAVMLAVAIQAQVTTGTVEDSTAIAAGITGQDETTVAQGTMAATFTDECIEMKPAHLATMMTVCESPGIRQAPVIHAAATVFAKSHGEKGHRTAQALIHPAAIARSHILIAPAMTTITS